MTRERAKELLPIIQAYSEGKVVQVRQGHTEFLPNPWQDYKGEAANFDNYNWEFRIKPKPREFWVKVYDKGNSLYVSSTPPPFNSERIVEVIHVREVLD